MKNVGLIILILFTVFTLFSCQKDSLPTDNPEGDFIPPHELKEEDKSALKAFLLSLTDHEMIHNPQYNCPPELKEWNGQ